MYLSYSSPTIRPTDYPLYEALNDLIATAVENASDESFTEDIINSIWPVFHYLVGKIDKNLSVPSERLCWH